MSVVFPAQHLRSVPNAPCGVESVDMNVKACTDILLVPNAPCGVESVLLFYLFSFLSLLFLMHRVELKESQTPLHVPIQFRS